MSTKNYDEESCVSVACYNDIAPFFKLGQRYTIVGKQKSRSGKTWQIILKPFEKRKK